MTVPRVALCEKSENGFSPVEGGYSGPILVYAAQAMGLLICKLCPDCSEWCPDPEIYSEWACDTKKDCPVYSAATRTEDATKRKPSEDRAEGPAEEAP